MRTAASRPETSESGSEVELLLPRMSPITSASSDCSALTSAADSEFTCAGAPMDELLMLGSGIDAGDGFGTETSGAGG